jgi:hypothetical protein
MDKTVVLTEQTVVSDTEAALEKLVITETETVVVENAVGTVVVTGIMGPPGRSSTTSVAELTDIDLTDLRDGAVLVYNMQNSRWQATERLEKQILEGGQF